MTGVCIAMCGDSHFFQAARLYTPPLLHAVALCEKKGNPPLRGLRHTLNERPIDFCRFPDPKNFADVDRDFAALGDEQHARSLAVEPMDEHRPLAALIWHCGKHAVDVAGLSRAALNGKTKGLVEYPKKAGLQEKHVFFRAYFFLRDFFFGGHPPPASHGRHAHTLARG